MDSPLARNPPGHCTPMLRWTSTAELPCPMRGFAGARRCILRDGWSRGHPRTGRRSGLLLGPTLGDVARSELGLHRDRTVTRVALSTARMARPLGGDVATVIAEKTGLQASAVDPEQLGLFCALLGGDQPASNAATRDRGGPGKPDSTGRARADIRRCVVEFAHGIHSSDRCAERHRGTSRRTATLAAPRRGVGPCSSADGGPTEPTTPDRGPCPWLPWAQGALITTTSTGDDEDTPDRHGAIEARSRSRQPAQPDPHRPCLPAHHADADAQATTAEWGDRWLMCGAVAVGRRRGRRQPRTHRGRSRGGRRDVEAECHARSGRPATTRVSAPVSGRYTSSHMDVPLAGHEESVGVRCNALRASPGNG